MNVVRIADPDRVKPLHVVMVCLMAVTVGGACLLTSGPHARIEGSKDWSQESFLRAVVHVLNLNYTQTTALGVEIKSLVFGIGTAVALAAGGLALLFGGRVPGEAPSPEPGVRSSFAKRSMSPLAASQLLMAAYVAWSFLSTQWSSAPDLAFGGSVLLATGALWAFVLGRGLNRPTSTTAAGILLGVCACTAVLAVAYYGERNPTRRASYPVGNPLFLAACLIPGILLSAGWLWASLRRARSRPILIVVAPLCAAAAGIMLYTVRLTSSRSTMIALTVGLAVMIVVGVPRKARRPVTLGMVVLMVCGVAFFWPRFTASSSTGRDASLRLRQYAWWYAIDLIEEAKIIGHGQGAFTQLGDAGAADDVIADPQALEARIAHAHNEWLEVAADLGAVGFTLALGALALCGVAGLRALPTIDDPWRRWALTALLATLVALIIEESADVALRIAGFPTIFYTVVGLIWALSRTPDDDVSSPGPPSPWRRRSTGAVGLIAGAALLWVSTEDFRAARAFHDVTDALQSRDFDRAVSLARSAAARRLNPQRRLDALERWCSTEIFIAREYQSSSVDRLAKANADSPDAPDPRLLRLSNEARTKCNEHIDRARTALEALVRRCPSYLGSGWLEYRLFQLRHVFAQVDADAELAERLASGAGDGLARELRRRPYDPLIALSYVEVARNKLTLAESLDILARPLRYTSIGPEYTEFIAGLVTPDGAFDRAFATIWQSIVPSEQGDASQDPFAPEKLRIAAVVRFLREEHGAALETAMMANRRYDAMGLAGVIGAAAARAEAAEYQFAADPGAWRAAVDLMQSAIDGMPDSTPGRAMAVGLKPRVVAFLLAGSDETSARALLAELMPAGSDAAIDAELGRQYAMLCRELMHGSRGAYTENFERCVGRALDLRPGDELVWRLKSQLEFDRGRYAESAASLRRAIEMGADPGVVYAFVELALRLDAGNAEFAALEQELRPVITGHDRAPPISPSAPVPPE